MGARTGSDYVNGLRGPREVWLDGERVSDVTRHRVFSRSVTAIAELYDMQCQPEWQDVLTYEPTDESGPAGTAFSRPQTRDDLVRRRKAIKTWADASFGMLGRSPDFFNTVLMAFAAARDFFSQVDCRFGENVTNLYSACRAKDLFLTRATISPQTDRSRSSSEQRNPDCNLRAVRETDNGVVVCGAKMISTNAPIADEMIVFPLPGLKPGDEDYVLAFCLPIETQGLRLICREAFDGGQRSHFDHPLSSHFEEMDAACVFDDVLVPWERVFFYRDVELANALYGETRARNHTGHHGMVRAWAKAELLVGTAVALAEMARTETFLHVQQMLGELLGYLEVIKGLIFLSEADGTLCRWGHFCPAIEPIQAFRCQFPQMNQRMVEAIQMLGGGSLLASPSERDLQSPIADDVLRYFAGADASAEDRIRLLKLAWDATGDAFGQRQLLYERYHAGDPVRIAASQYWAYDKEPLREVVRRALSQPVREDLDKRRNAGLAAALSVLSE